MKEDFRNSFPKSKLYFIEEYLARNQLVSKTRNRTFLPVHLYILPPCANIFQGDIRVLLKFGTQDAQYHSKGAIN